MYMPHVRRHEGEVHDPFARLIEDHERMRALLDMLVDSRDIMVANRELVLEEVYVELELHGELERAMFSPEGKTLAQRLHILKEAPEDHHRIVTLLSELETTDHYSDEWLVKALAFKQDIEYHMWREEHVCFPTMRISMSKYGISRLLERANGFLRQV